MLQIAIDLGTYVLIALGGAAVLFLLASAGVVVIPKRAKKVRPSSARIIPKATAAKLRESWDEATEVLPCDDPIRGSF